MERKHLLPIILSSAMMLMWACGEGEIIQADDNDEMMRSKSDPKDLKNSISDYEFLQPYLDYCKSKEGKKKGCVAELIKSSSSQNEETSSSTKAKPNSSASSSNSGKVNSSGSTKSSSSGKVNSSGSTGSSSSSKQSSSSSKRVLPVSGECVLVSPPVVYVDDEIMWRYLPDENSIDSANYTWTDENKNKDVEKGLVDGELSGSGLPEITVKFSEKGKKLGPTLVFGGKEFDCKNLIVHVEGEDISSSSEEESSSSARSSSSVRSSSSSVPEGHCEVSKSKVFVDEVVEWYIAGPDGEVLSAFHNWSDIGAGGEIVSGERRGNGSTKISVKYTSTGVKETLVQFAKQGMLSCDNDSEGEPLLIVEAKPTSSSATVVESSSSSEGKLSSSKENPRSSSSFDVIDI